MLHDIDETQRLLRMIADGVRHSGAEGHGISPELRLATVAHALVSHSEVMTADAANDFLHRLWEGKTKPQRDAMLAEIDGYIAKLDDRRQAVAA